MAPNVVSLLPSATEMLYAIGVEPVAVSHECDHPPAAREKPAANRARIDARGSSADVNEAVAEAEAADGVYELREDVLRAVEPDLLVTQGVCDVCAVSDELVRERTRELGLDADVVATHPHSFDDVLADIERIGEATGREERAVNVVEDLRSRIERLRQQAPGDDRRVLVVDWMDPVMVAGHWVPEMIEWLGGEYGMADPGERSRPRRFDEVLAYDPEVLIVAPCGFDLDRTIDAFDDVASHDGWSDLTAVRDGEVYAMNGHDFVNRPGPRLVDTLAGFASVLHPGEFGKPSGDVVRRVSSAASSDA